MFNFFANLALSIYTGTWQSVSTGTFTANFTSFITNLPLWNMFNQSNENTWTLGTNTISYSICTILSIICCISVFFIIVKAVKKLFTFFLDI